MMRDFKKLLLGAVFASLLSVSFATQDAKAVTVSFTPPATEFSYERSNLADTTWEAIFVDPMAGVDNISVLSKTLSGISQPFKIGYMSFDVSNSIFADPSTSGFAKLKLLIDDVDTNDPIPAQPHNHYLSIYRVNDAAVIGTNNGDIIASGNNPPIALGQLLDTEAVTDAFDNTELVFNFNSLIHSSLVAGVPYLSFAIVADNNLSLVLPEQASILVTPAPEPMSAAYMIIGGIAFAFRRIKNAVLGLS